MTFICRQKINFTLHIFLESLFLLQRYCELVLGTLGMRGYALQKRCYQFIENFRKYLYAKNQLYPPCFSEDWLSLFWPITQELELCQIWDRWWNINNNINFHFRLFPRKNNEKFFKEIQKKLFWGKFGPFLLRFGQKLIFVEKRALLVFKYSNYFPLCHESEKTNEPFLRKMLKWWMDRKTDR